MKKQTKVTLLMVGMVFLLCACGKEEPIEDFPLPREEAESTQTMQEKDTQSLKDGVKELVASAQELAASLEASIEKDTLSQTEYNEKAQQLYKVWDDALNSVWKVLTETLPEEERKLLQEEEREWIAKKEQEITKAGAEVEGGSMYPLVTGLKAAELTKIRVYELLELID